MINYAKIFAENRANVVRQNSKQETAKIVSKIDKIEKTDLFTIKGVGEGTVKLLLENGISSKEELINSGIKRITELNLNPLSAKAIKEFLKNN